jgi:secreted PhoX family phosphatase
MSQDVCAGAASFDDVVRARYGRRHALQALAAGVGGAAVLGVGRPARATGPSYAPGELTYDAVPPSTADEIVLAAGLTHDVLLSWGDPVLPGAPAHDVLNQTGAAQAQQAGFNHDYVAFFSLPNWKSSAPQHGLLWVNHEYTDSRIMFENYTSSLDQVDTEMAAHGGTVVEIARNAAGVVSYDPNSSFNRRITATTPMRLTGPVAGDSRVKTSADPTGRNVLGMLNNCGGGRTPWGTVLTCEENFDQYFGNKAAMPDGYAKTAAETYGPASGASERKWETHYDRFDLAKEPNELNRFGWVVEVDPYNPASRPKKRTALGRFKHEAASGTVSTRGKFVVYSGDDQSNQCIYKFVTAHKVNPDRRADNMNLLDEGTLYVARFNPDGSGNWLPLVYGAGPLVQPAFTDQADVLIRARQAAAALGATKMARPEDIDVNPVTKKVYAAMTGNSGAEVNAANPRTGGSSIAGNGLGHVIEITEANGDNASLTFHWEIILLCGEPGQTGAIATPSSPAALNDAADNVTWWAGFDETRVSPIARVDNLAFDSKGNLFMSTDGQPTALQRGLDGVNDTLVGVPVEGPERGHAKALLYGVDGCEVTGPYFTPDDATLFVAIQHPGVDGVVWTSPTTAPTGSTGTFAAPKSTWNTTPPITGRTPGVPRSAVLVVRRIDGGPIAYGAAGPDPVVPEFPAPIVATAGAAAAVGGLIAWRQRRMGGTPA